MVIDFHTHSFPKEIAEAAIKRLSEAERLQPFTDATNEGLHKSMVEAGVDISVLLPVATKPSQTRDINRIAAQTVEAFESTGIWSFGAVHPDNEDYRDELKFISEKGLKGVKLHPVFQRMNFDDRKYLNILDYAYELGLIVSVHAGYDITYPDAGFVTVERIRNVCKILPPQKLILAHMGAWKGWDAAEELLAEYPTYVDTAFVLSQDGKNTFFDTDVPAMKKEQFLRITRMLGADKVLFGTDSPWTGQKESIATLMESGLTEEELNKVLGGNAAKLLGVDKDC